VATAEEMLLAVVRAEGCEGREDTNLRPRTGRWLVIEGEGFSLAC
jgi:hypothetical protein